MGSRRAVGPRDPAGTRRTAGGAATTRVERAGGTGLPLLLLLSLATVHDAPFACLLLEWTLRLYGLRPRIIGSIPASGACA
jgi:hypothetical protein